MLTQAQVQRYATESGLRDIMIAEKEAILTFLLQLLTERAAVSVRRNLIQFRSLVSNPCRASIVTAFLSKETNVSAWSHFPS